MRKTSLIFSLLLAFSLLLSACAGGEAQEGAGSGTPGVGETTGTQEAIPETGAGTESPMGTVEPTQGAAPTDLATEAASPTGAATAESAETAAPTMGAGDTGSTTPTAEATGQSGSGQAGGAQGAGAGLIGIPETGSGGLVGLAAMMDWSVVGADGTAIGTVTDYVVNMCEAHILYLVVDPAEGVSPEGGQQVLIPFEAVLGELNEGSSVDVAQRVFILKQNVADLTGVPGVDIASVDMEAPDWSRNVDEYWSANYRLSLTAGCNIPVTGSQGGAGDTGQQATAMPTTGGGATTLPEGTAQPTLPASGDGSGSAAGTAAVTATADGTQNAGGDRQTIYRVALAGEVLTADLRDGNGQVLGTVQDIAIVPETGRTQYIVVETGEGGGSGQGGRMVAVPPGAVNVSYEGGDQPVLVLLVETALLDSAPEFDQNNTWTDDNWFNFWNQYVPLTREQQP